ncbi:MAG: autoinducer binding domain-containing protein [Pseudomonadales bacterium]|nr:autoinducer binding domain-containing protein [Pseudomonadales bacterium]
MKYWFEDQLQSLLQSDDKDEFIRGIIKAVESLGFEYYAYGLRVSIPITNPKYEFYNNYPAAWKKVYQQEGYLEQDPTVRHGLRTIQPVVWEELMFDESKAFWEDAKSHGLSHGWAQSARLDASSIGMLTLARSGETLTSKELSSKTPYLLWLNQLVQMGFQRLLLPKLQHNYKASLTEKEIEVIKWCAEGKTSDEIGIILNTSKRTVNFHTANIIKKLNVSNKTAAAIRAVQLGFIS